MIEGVEGEMAEVINISSESDEDHSDVEIVRSYGNILVIDDPLLLSTGSGNVEATNVNITPGYIDLTDSQLSPELKTGKTPNSTQIMVVDLTESEILNGTEQETEKWPKDVSKIKNDRVQKGSTEDPPVLSLQQDCGDPKPQQSRMESQKQQQKWITDIFPHKPVIESRRVPFPESHITKLKTSQCSLPLNKDCTQMPLQARQPDCNSEEPDDFSNLTITSNDHVAMTPDTSAPKHIEYQEQIENYEEFRSSQIIFKTFQHQASPGTSDKSGSFSSSKENITREDFGQSKPIHSPKTPSSSQRGVLFPNHEQIELDKTNSGQSRLSVQPSSTELNPSKPLDVNCMSHASQTSPNCLRQFNPASNSEHSVTETCSVFKADEGKSLLPGFKTVDWDNGSEPELLIRGMQIVNPLTFHWEEWSDGEQVKKDGRLDMDSSIAGKEDRHFVCPVTLRRLMSGSAQAQIHVEDEGFGPPVLLCRQSLSVVYSTIQEHYPEGTLQLLSDLLQPGYYPPKDITYHLLHGILLNPQCPPHMCAQAFHLLMRTQRHHMADRTTVPWDWEQLTSVMDNQDHKKRNQCKVVRMFLEYVVQTLEDDFRAKCSTSALQHSISKDTLSCVQHFSNVRDVIKWLFSAIAKSTEQKESGKAAAEGDEQIRMVLIFQKMLSLALEVERSPVLSSSKLSQELFLMLIGNLSLRAHRMLLLESLQSHLLRCKLLEQLLDYCCPEKTSLPMSLSLLLHFMKNCTLAPDPTDGPERWQRWGELVNLLWMLLLSYNKAMKGCLRGSVSEQRGRRSTSIYKKDDMLSKPAVCEAMESFLSRSQADIGQALPLHVEESLSYLQDHLLDTCQ